jgi:hypothetical protein
MKKIILFVLGIFTLCFSITCRKKDDDSCPVCPNISAFSPSHGKSGDTVTVAGENFTTNPDGLKLKATINGKDVSVISILSDRQMKIIVPDKCGTGPIRVYYDEELSSLSANAFIYDRVGITSTFAGKCGSTIDNADPLLAEFTSPTKVFLDEPRNIVYAIIADDKTLVRIGPSGVKKIIDTDPLIIRSGSCDASGNIYLAFDEYIAKVDNAITPTLTPIAGLAGSKGHTDGKGNIARFSSINDLLMDGNTMYIAEATYIRKMDINNLNVTTIAGTGTAGFLDGPALTAKFSSIVSIAMDKNQNLYIADWSNNRMRRLSNGIVSTIAGDGTQAVKNGIGTAAQLQSPRSVVVNNDATFLYFSDDLTSFIRKIDLSNAAVSYFSGDLTLTGSQDGPVEIATYFQPRGFVYAKGMDAFYMADYFNCKIRKITFQ